VKLSLILARAAQEMERGAGDVELSLKPYVFAEMFGVPMAGDDAEIATWLSSAAEWAKVRGE